MGSRRIPDSPHPSGPALPEAVPRSATPAAQPPDAAVKKSTKKGRTGARQSQAVIAATKTPMVSADDRRAMIAKAAYLRGEQRGFAPGGEAEDWLAAEQEINALLGGVSGGAQ